jgi:hypothetical protein
VLTIELAFYRYFGEDRGGLGNINHPMICEGLPGVYSTIWCLCYKTNKLKKKKQKERRWACLHRLEKRG